MGWSDKRVIAPGFESNRLLSAVDVAIVETSGPSPATLVEGLTKPDAPPASTTDHALAEANKSLRQMSGAMP